MKKIQAVILGLLVVGSAIAQSGGGFNLEQNVIGNGGWRSEGGGFTVLGTMGQGNAGSTATGGAFHLIDGLWAIENPAANSPFVNISGRVVRAKGVGISRALLTITDQTSNLMFQVWSEDHGYYRFPAIVTGANYVIKVSHPHFQFELNAISLFVSQERNDIDFVSNE